MEVGQVVGDLLDHQLPHLAAPDRLGLSYSPRRSWRTSLARGYPGKPPWPRAAAGPALTSPPLRHIRANTLHPIKQIIFYRPLF